MSEILQTWSREILSLAILYPLLWYILKSNQKYIENLIKDNKQCAINVTNSFKDEMNKFYVLLEGHIKQDSEDFKAVQKAIADGVGKTTLNKEQIIEVSRARVWLTSEKKLDFIKKRLEKNNLKERRSIIEKQIASELSRRSDEYIDFLNQFNSNVGLIGDWIKNNFPMQDFLSEVYDVIFREGDNILLKIEDIRFLMLGYQNELFEKLKKELI